MEPVNVTYILSNINKALAFEWIAVELDQQRFHLSFILLNPGESELERFLVHKGINTYRITYRGKRDLPAAIGKIAALLRKGKTNVVHCHLFDASVAGLLAAKLAAVPKRIYTRHHSTLHHLYFPRAVWYDRLINYLATDIIAISRNVQDILIDQEKVAPAKVHLLHHGFKLEEFPRVGRERITALRAKYHLPGRHPVVGVISRCVAWKGIQYVIPAFGKLLDRYPNAHLVIANAVGDFLPQVEELLKPFSAGSYTLIPFEADVYALYKVFDLFVHVPINDQIEAFGQTYVEALAAGVPSVFTLSGVAPEFIQSGSNALVVPFQDSDAIYQALIQLVEDEPTRMTVQEQGMETVRQKFELKTMIAHLEELYLA